MIDPHIMQTRFIRSAKVSTGKTKILVIEDDDATAEFMKLFFEMSDFGYYIRGGLPNILPIINDYKPDLVILDYLLPEINGGELCRQIKKNPGTCVLPVLIYSRFPKVMSSLDDGYDAFISNLLILMICKRRLKT